MDYCISCEISLHQSDVYVFPAHHSQLPHTERLVAELRLRLLYQRSGLHRHTAHHTTHPRDQRQHPHTLSGLAALLWLPKVPHAPVPVIDECILMENDGVHVQLN